jgi:hypothetical protein
MEEKAFSPSYDLAPSPSPPPSPASNLSLCLSLPVCCPSITDGRGGRRGEEPNHTTTRKSGPLKYIQYSLRQRIVVSERIPKLSVYGSVFVSADESWRAC